ncbi:MAG: hypothetical protein Q9227_002718 [Pyrenula ochraceoflavens]
MLGSRREDALMLCTARLNIRSQNRNGPISVSTSGSLHGDNKHERKNKRRGFRDLIYRSDSTRQAARRSDYNGRDDLSKAKNEKPNSKLAPDVLCSRNVDGNRCWSARPGDVADSWKKQVDSILYSHDHELFQKDGRALSVYYEVFFLGQNVQTARPAVVISCTSEEDKERVRKLIKKYPHVPDSDGIALVAMLGSPRSSVPLIKLALGESTESLVKESPVLTEGTPVFGNLGPGGLLSIPAMIWVGEPDHQQHQATLGGLVSSETVDDAKFGLTVAHLSASGIGKGLKSTSKSSRTAIGTVNYVSAGSGIGNLDWALIRLSKGIHARTSIAPPTSVQAAPIGPTIINVATSRGLVRGSISESVTFVNLDGASGSTKTRPIVTDEPMKIGDSGAWVIGPDNELYGQVAYGHGGERIAYIVSVADIFEDIEKKQGKVRLSTVRSSARQEMRKQDRNLSTSRTDGALKKPNVQRVRSGMQNHDASKKHHEMQSGFRERVTRRCRKEKGQKYLKSLGVVLTYLIFLAIIKFLYFSVSAYALSVDSNVAQQMRDKLAGLMAQTTDELNGQMRKETDKYDRSAVTEREGSGKALLDGKALGASGEGFPQKYVQHYHQTLTTNFELQRRPLTSFSVSNEDGGAKPSRGGLRSLWSRVRNKCSRTKADGDSSSTNTSDFNALQYAEKYIYSDDSLSDNSESTSPEPLYGAARAFYDSMRSRREQRRKRRQSRGYDSDGSRDRRRSRRYDDYGSRDHGDDYDDYHYIWPQRRSCDRSRKYDDYGSRDRRDDYDDYYYTRSRHRSRDRSRSRSRSRRRPTDTGLFEYGADPIYGDASGYSTGYPTNEFPPLPSSAKSEPSSKPYDPYSVQTPGSYDTKPTTDIILHPNPQRNDSNEKPTTPPRESID